MKSLRMMLLAAVLALTGTAQADNLAVGSVTMVPGQTKEVAISLENPQQAYTAFQLELVLPEGVTMVRDAQGRLMARLDDGRKADHVLNAADKGGGVCRLMSFSLSNSPFAGTDGPLLHVTLHADESLTEGTLTAVIQKQVMTGAGGTQEKWTDLPFAIGIESGNDHLAVEPLTLVPGQTQELAICLENPLQTYAAFQLELVLPAGIAVARGSDGRLMARLADGRKADHVLNVAAKGGGAYRLMSFSLSNAAYGGQEGPLVYVALEAADDAPSAELTATLRSPVFTQADGTQVKWADVSFAITVGGEVIAGDVNSDGRVDGLDAVTLARYLIGEDPVPFNAAAANVNGDDGISIADVAGVIEISRSRNLEMAPSKYRNTEISK
jgi:hypothetical protein